MHTGRSLRGALVVFVTTALIVSIAGIVPAGATLLERGEPPKSPRVTSGSLDLIGAKLDSRLAEMVSAAGRTGTAAEAVVEVAVLAAKDSAAPADVIRPLKMTLRGDPDNDLWVGTAKVNRLLKIASAAGVTFVYENGRREPEAIPDSGGDGADMTDAERASAAVDMQDRIAEALDAGAADAFAAQFDDEGVLVAPAAADDGGSAMGFFDVQPEGHDSQGAWAQGYTGDGVRVAVADDSCDFGHPDLMGTNAVVEDAASPYFGWPQAFDPYSLLLYAYDSYYGETNVANGDTWFTDTSATITDADPVFDTKTLTTPGTSLSGTYHVGYLWDENFYEYYGINDFPVVLVADENTSGVFDTVYVDLDADLDFTTDKPCTKSSPVSYADLWDASYNPTPDGFADISGGMIYWIADGTNQPPGAEFMFGAGFPTTAGAGDMVCFMGALNLDEDHGTLCSSNVVGQGNIDGPSVWGDYPPFKTPDPLSGNGIVQGAAPDAGLVAIADIYWNHFNSTLAAYDYAAFGLDEETYTGDDLQVVSNSYGESAEDADGWDYRSRYITYLNTYYNNEVTFLFSTGNGAPGYGTTAPPGPATGIAVGASTQMGACGGWDSILDADQVTVGDVIPWSNRGPSASGGLAPDIVADGAYSSGAVPVNMYWYEGSTSWDVWGGTSRSCPVAAGNLALIFQAYKDRTGSWPDNETARGLLMNGARDLNYDTLVQGAGSVDASRSVGIAAGNGGVSIQPSSWNPGDYLGERFTSFANVVHPGESYETVLQMENTSAAAVDMTASDTWYENSGSTSFGVSLDASELDSYDFNRPDYLRDITDMIPDGTDLVVIRTSQSIEDFAPTGAFDTDPTTHNVTRPLVYDWKDQDTSGTLWTDSNSNGFVNAGEVDDGEYMRFTYHNNFANTHELRVQTPKERMHDGVFLGLQWSTRADGSDTTQLAVEISFWNRVDCDWLSVDDPGVIDPGGSVTPSASLDVPADAPVGIYEAQIRCNDGTNVSVVPVVVNVAADTYDFEFGDVPGAYYSLMENDAVFGAQDWGWRAESGDWRFFWTDASAEDELPLGASWLVHTSWLDRDVPDGMDSDLDTLLYGPQVDEFSAEYPETFGPYALGLSGGSANTNIGDGIWTFQTNTGTTEEWVAGSLEAGLNQIMIHNTLYDGRNVGLRFSGESGVISVDPSRLDIVTREDEGAESVDFTTYSLPLTGAAAQAYGLTRRVEETPDISNGDSWWYDAELTDAAYFDVSTACEGQDIDLYVYYSDGGAFGLVGASESSSGEEHVRIASPANGTYRVEVYGYEVSGTQPFDVTISSPMGDDLELSGIPAGEVAAGGGFTLDVDWAKVHSGSLQEREGEFEGVVYLGPVEAPGAVEVPVTLRYPFEVESSTPASGAAGIDLDSTVEVTFSKRVDQTSLDDSTFTLMKGTLAVPGSIEYNDLDATAVFTPDSPLKELTGYELVIDGVMSVDGDELVTDIAFTTGGLIVDRIAAADRLATAIEVSKAAFEDGTADSVVIATAYDWPDALGGASLAGALDCPILLTRAADLPQSVVDEIDRLGASEAIILGGTAAVNASVETALESELGANVERLGGVNRYATARLIAARAVYEQGAGYDGTAFLATGANFPDALGASPLAAANGWPIYLVDPRAGADAALVNAMKSDGVDTALVLGGTAAIATSVESGVEANVPCVATRLAGQSRYETAVKVATYGVSHAGLAWNQLAIATGTNFPDALAGGVLQGKHGSVMLLTPPTSLDPDVRDVLETNKATIDTVHFLGGSAAVSDGVMDAVVGILE